MKGWAFLLALVATVHTEGAVLLGGRSAAHSRDRPIQTIPKLVPIHGPPKVTHEEVAKEVAAKKPKEESAPPKEGGAEHSSEGEGGGESAGWAVATVIFLGIFFASSLFAMTQSAIPHVGNNTVLVIDNIIAIFLAVLWFQGFDDLTKVLPEDHHKTIAALVHAVLLLFMALAVAHSLRHKSTSLAIFCGCGAHYCAFASGHYATTVQELYFKDHPVQCFFGLVGLLMDLIVGGFLLYKVKTWMGMKPGVEVEDEGDNAFIDRFDDVETDFGAMALAMYWVVFVQFSIMGQWPRDDIDPGTKPAHSDGDRAKMFAYTVGLFMVAPLALEKLSGMVERSYFKSRMLGLLQSFIAMSMAFAFLTWGKMQFYEHEAMSVSPILFRIYFAAMCSAVAMIGIVMVSSGRLSGAVSSSCLVALGLIAGFSWEETFDQAVEDMVEGSKYEAGAKMAIAVLGAAVILPTYANYVKPKSMKAADEEGG